MTRQTRQMLIIFLGAITVWDTITTITGTLSIIGDGNISIFLSILFGVIISSFLLATIPIIRNPKDDIIVTGAKILWGLALCYDLYTSFTGNQKLIANSDYSIGQIVIIIGMTLFVSSSPIAISYLRNEVEII